MSTRAESIPRSTERAEPTLVTRLVHSRTEVAPIWKRLEASLRSTGLANSWEWTDCWLNAYGDSVPHWFVVAERAGHAVGVALLTRGRKQRRGPLPIRTAHIGTAGEARGTGVWVEYNRVLVTPGDRTAFLTTLISVPGASLWAADVLEWNGFAPEELPAQIRSGLRLREESCFVTTLTDSATVLESFDGDTRRKIRKNMKRFGTAFGDLSTEWIESTERAQEVMRELVSHHQARWTSAGKPGAFATDRFQRFHRELIDRLLPAGRIVLARVSAGKELVGIFYGFVEDEIIYHYQWGLPHFDDNSLSPGFVTGYLVMEEAKERGFSELNWLAGDSRYKRDLSNHTRTLIWAEKSLSPWHTAINGLISIYEKLPAGPKRMIRGQ
jgi:CelD/BcsL family acetyltransferase involved in cellulose biosynthesis